MSFAALSPGAAAALLAAAAAAVLALYQLRPPPRRLGVSSLLLWRAARTRPSPLERLRWWLSLLLASAIALLLALALAGLRLGAGSAPTLIVVDTAPGMQTRRAGGETRLERARREASAILDALGDGAQVRVADTCGGLGALGSTAAARAALARLRPCPAPGGTLPARRSDEARLVLISDGVADLAPPPDAERVSVFEPALNVGITAFEVTAEAEPGRAVIEVVNASADALEARLSLRAGEWSAEELLRLGAGEALALVRELPPQARGLIEASVSAAGDALGDDDRALAWLGAARWRVRLVGAPDRFLELALRLDPRVALVGESETADLVIASGGDPPAGLPWLALPGPDAAAAPAPRLIDDWRRDHPLFAAAPPTDAALRPLLTSRSAGLEVIASAGGAPAIAVQRLPQRGVRLGFPLADSSWPRQPGFALFLGNALEWLAGPAALVARPGVVALPLPGARVFDPDGAPVSARSLEGATRFEADRSGTWLARVGDRELPILVSRVDRDTTMVNRSRLASAPPAALAQTAGSPDLPPLLLLLAALLLGFEWWSWRRRLTL